jgi:translocation and assembly module TamA
MSVRIALAPIAFALLALALCVPAEARIFIDVNGVDSDLRRNILVFLSLERYQQRDRLPRETIERLQNRAPREVKSALRPFGYYEPQVHTRLEDLGNGHDWRVVIDVDPGAPILMGTVSVKLSGSGAADPLFTKVVQEVKLKSGARLSHADYDAAKTALQRAATTYGYLDARFVVSELKVEPQHHRADATLELDTGERYRFGPTRIEQSVISDRLVRKFLRYREGDPYDANQLLRTQFALDDSQYFSTLEVLPGDRDRERHTVPIEIHAAASRRHRYQFGLGYGTDTGARGIIGWDDRHLDEQGHRLHVELQAAANQSILDARYIIPIEDPAIDRLTLESTFQRTIDNGDLTFTQLSFQPSVSQVLGSWQRVFFALFTNERTNAGSVSTTDTLLIPGVSFASVPRDYLGEELFSRAFTVDLRGSQRYLGADSDFLQLRVHGERAFEIAPAWHFFVRGDLGASLVQNFALLPGSQRFFAGGDRSVRGYGFNDLSPVTEDPNTHLPVALGGRDLATGTLEFERDLPQHFGIAFFADAGNAFSSWNDHLKYSIGIGMRFRLPVVTIGVDIAQPLVGEDCLNTSISTNPECRHGVLPVTGPRLHLNISPKL